jgi:V/A-type H+-transporting ATPase subunit A
MNTATTKKTASTGKVTGIIANLVIVQFEGPVAQNEVCFIQHPDAPLMAEVIKIIGDRAYVQAFESTRSLRVGLPVVFEGHLLEATLGPGVLSRIYDGLMHDLAHHDRRLPAKRRIHRCWTKKRWGFQPVAQPGNTVAAGDWLGEVRENSILHRIMVPFTLEGSSHVQSVAAAGEYRVNDTIAILRDQNGRSKYP